MKLAVTLSLLWATLATARGLTCYTGPTTAKVKTCQWPQVHCTTITVSELPPFMRSLGAVSDSDVLRSCGAASMCVHSGVTCCETDLCNDLGIIQASAEAESTDTGAKKTDTGAKKTNTGAKKTNTGAKNTENGVGHVVSGSLLLLLPPVLVSLLL